MTFNSNSIPFLVSSLQKVYTNLKKICFSKTSYHWDGERLTSYNNEQV